MSKRTFWAYVLSGLVLIFGVLTFHSGFVMDVTVPGSSFAPELGIAIPSGQRVINGPLVLTKIVGLMGASLIILAGLIGLAAALLCHTIESRLPANRIDD